MQFLFQKSFKDEINGCKYNEDFNRTKEYKRTNKITSYGDVIFANIEK